MDVFSIPYRPGLLRSFIDDFEIGEFGDGFFGKISRGRATLQFYLTGNFGDVTLQVYPSASLMLVSSKVPLGRYLKAVAERHGIDQRDVRWEIKDLACVLKERGCEPVMLSVVVSELPWALTTFKERGIMIACGYDVTTDASLPQKETSPPWAVPGVNTALAFFRDLVPWTPSEPTDREGVEDAIDQACMARNVVVLRGLLKKGAPRQTAYDHCLADVPCMSALAAVLPPTGEQLHAIARAVSLHDFMKIYNSIGKHLGPKTD